MVEPTLLLLLKVPNKSFGKKHFANNRRHKTPFNSKNHMRGGKLILEISKKLLYIYCKEMSYRKGKRKMHRVCNNIQQRQRCHNPRKTSHQNYH